MKTDVPWRKVRYIEVLSDGDLLSGEGHWPLVDGWFEKAELLRPASPKGLVGGPGMITLPDGARFREVSFKTEHEIMELALPVWAQEAGRRWAKVVGDTLSLSDGSRWKKSDLRISGYPTAVSDLSSMPWLHKIKDDAEAEVRKHADPAGTDNDRAAPGRV
jgi:hypothetical protein